MGWGERYDTDEEEQEVHVLAVDDSFVDRKVIERLLRSSACKVTVVESGRRALQLLGLDEEKKGRGDFHGLNPKVDMVITDYCMPGMTGYELLKRIKESSALREIPVVVMSSERIVDRIDRCMEEGAKEFLLKPVKLSDVKRLKDNMRRGESRPRNESSAARKRKHEDKHSSAEQNSSSSPTSSPSTSFWPPPSLSSSIQTDVSGQLSPTPLVSGSPRQKNQNGLLTAEGISDIF